MSPNVDAANYCSTEILKTGKAVEIRSLRQSDRADLEQAVKRETTQSLYRRFFTVKREFSEKEAEFYINVDFVKHVALVAIVTEDGKPAIVGGGRYVTVQPNEAEVAFSIIDEYQGRGLGTLLMRHLIAIARSAGFKTLIAEVLPENVPMLKVFEKCGCSVSKRHRDGVVHVVIDLVS